MNKNNYEILYYSLKNIKIYCIVLNIENENKRSVLPPFALNVYIFIPRLVARETDNQGGGAIYGRISFISNYQTTFLWISRCNYHKFCLDIHHLVFTTQAIKNNHSALTREWLLIKLSATTLWFFIFYTYYTLFFHFCQINFFI